MSTTAPSFTGAPQDEQNAALEQQLRSLLDEYTQRLEARVDEKLAAHLEAVNTVLQAAQAPPVTIGGTPTPPESPNTLGVEASSGAEVQHGTGASEQV